MWSSMVSDPLDELAAAPDVISGGGEDFSAFVVSRWPGLVRLAFGLTGDRWAAEDIAQATLARAYVAWRRVSQADDPDAFTSPGSPGDPEMSVCGPISTPEGPETIMAMPLSYPPIGLKAPTGYAVQVSPRTAGLRATASDGSTQLVTPRVVDGRRYAAFVIGTSLRLERLTWLDATGKAFASTISLPLSGYTQFQP
jgi:hypothetical protein